MNPGHCQGLLNLLTLLTARTQGSGGAGLSNVQGQCTARLTLTPVSHVVKAVACCGGAFLTAVAVAVTAGLDIRGTSTIMQAGYSPLGSLGA